jgi:hypothetical protein
MSQMQTYVLATNETERTHMQNAKRDNGQAITDFLSTAGHTSTLTTELTLAAAEVVFRRMTLGGFALVNPAAADHAEFARMVPEKTRAFSDAGLILISRSEQIRRKMGRLVADEMTLAAQAATDVMAARDPASVIAFHVDAAASWAARLATLPRTMCLLALKAQTAAMAPIHRAATDNVERLRSGGVAAKIHETTITAA